MRKIQQDWLQRPVRLASRPKDWPLGPYRQTLIAKMVALKGQLWLDYIVGFKGKLLSSLKPTLLTKKTIKVCLTSQVKGVGLTGQYGWPQNLTLLVFDGSFLEQPY